MGRSEVVVKEEAKMDLYRDLDIFGDNRKQRSNSYLSAWVRCEDTEVENAVVRREATMTRMVDIVRLMARDIIHSNKSEKPKVRAIELPH